MELQTLFKRESAADLFLIRILSIVPSSVLSASGASSVPNLLSRMLIWRAGKPSQTGLSVLKWRCFKTWNRISGVPHKCTSPVYSPLFYSIHQMHIRYLIQVPIHQASSDPCPGRPSARCWGWGWGRGVRY
jgi:hypothetical protein